MPDYNTEYERALKYERSTEEAFHRAIHENPDEDTNSLVYADWLEENGKPAHAEVIRGNYTKRPDHGKYHLYEPHVQLHHEHTPLKLEPGRTKAVAFLNSNHPAVVLTFGSLHKRANIGYLYEALSPDHATTLIRQLAEEGATTQDYYNHGK